MPWNRSRAFWNPRDGCIPLRFPSPLIDGNCQRQPDSGTQLNAPKSSAGHSGLGLSCSPSPEARFGLQLPGQPGRPALSKAAECRQVRGGGAPRPPAAGGRGTGAPPGSPAAAGSGSESARPRATPRSGPRKWPSPPARRRRRARGPGAGTPERRAREEPPRAASALGERAGGAAAYPAGRRRSVLPLPRGPPRPRLPLSRPAARSHRDKQIHMESRFIKTHVQPPATYLYSRSGPSASGPLAPRSAAAPQQPRRALSPARGGDPEAPRARVGVAGGVPPREAAEPRLSSDFSRATFRAPLTSAVAALPSLRAPRAAHSPISSRIRALLGLFRGVPRSLRLPRPPPLPSSRGLALDRAPSRPENSQQLRSAASRSRLARTPLRRQLLLPRRRRSPPRGLPILAGSSLS